MKLRSKFGSIFSLVALALAVYRVQALAPAFGLERRFDAKPAPKPPKGETKKLIPPNFYRYKLTDVEGSETMNLRWAAEYIWSGAFEFGQLKKISKSGKKSKNILKSGVQKCLAVRDKTTENGTVVVDACACTTGPCNKDNNINSPEPRFQWNIRGRILYPQIYENGILDFSAQKGEFGEKQLPFWYGWIETALSGKCLTYVPPKEYPPPFTEQGMYGKIGDVVVRECSSDPAETSQLWLIWIFKKDVPTRIIPMASTHRWQTCVAKGSNKKRHFRGLVFNTDPNSEDAVYFGCHDNDHTAINAHPWHFRVPEGDVADISDQELDKFAAENLVDFA